MSRLAQPLFALSAVSLYACQPSTPSSQGEAKTQVTASSTASVGYDLRRLRPTDEELGPRFNRLRAKAVEENKRAVVMFSADWCEPCRRIDLELGNMHPPDMIGDIRIFELKEEDWKQAARMDEFDGLRTRWSTVKGRYPFVVMLDGQGQKVEEMKEAKERLEAAGVDPTLPQWFATTRPDAASSPSSSESPQ